MSGLGGGGVENRSAPNAASQLTADVHIEGSQGWRQIPQADPEALYFGRGVQVCSVACTCVCVSVQVIKFLYGEVLGNPCISGSRLLPPPKKNIPQNCVLLV